ncbi:uncharacterized protein LOC124806975 [Hydra vulgaris]|uniref:uncharacterized protein LOC124806975 n=1 Tax=Hydra vulgaris TaxID=6087 RepID=UPI001F5F1A03|nr:uncharacterized protein LOC124806975 [Hydra vulgaris]
MFITPGSCKSLPDFWSQWSEWSQCDTSFIITRTRNCSQNLSFYCPGNSSEVQSCSNQALVELRNPYIGGIYFIKTMNADYGIDLLGDYGDHARVVKNSTEMFFCVEGIFFWCISFIFKNPKIKLESFA